MKTCSLVCQYFHARARIHLFSQICLCLGMEEHCRRRARKFLSILKYKKNSDLISHCIRSVKILVYQFCRDCYRTEGPAPCCKYLLKLVGIDANPLEEVLAKFKNAPIKELIIQGANDMPCEFPKLRVYGTVLLAMCSNPNLKNLRVEELRGFPFRFITGSSDGGGFTQLALREVTISDYWCRIQPPTVVLTGIKTLELVQMSSDQFLKVLHQLSPSPKSLRLPNLNNLVISLPHWDFKERAKVWNVILGVAGTLESLELCLSAAHLYGGEVSPYFHLEKSANMLIILSDPGTYDIRPLCLNPLKSLKRLKIVSIHNWRCAHVFRGELALMAIMLASSASPIHIRSIILETSFGRLPDRQAWLETPSFLNPDKWLIIDVILVSPRFVDLRMVEVTVNGSPASFKLGEGFPDLGEINFKDLLPTISHHSRMSLMTSATLGSRQQTAVYELYPIDRDII